MQCCNPEINGGGGWGIFNAILGWQNSATYGSVLSYNFYWIVIILAFVAMRYHEKNGHWPLMKSKGHPEPGRSGSGESSDVGASIGGGEVGKAHDESTPSAHVKEVQG
jgi:high-affinity iron transporter